MYTCNMDSKERLIETTRDLLWKRGYTATSPKVIQKQSGVGQGSMYHHFKGKSGLALEAIRKNAEELKTNLDERLSKETTAMEKIKAFLSRKRNIQMGCRIGGLTHDPSIIADKYMRRVLQKSFEWIHQSLADVIREGQAKNEFEKNFNADDAAYAIIAVLQGGYVLAKASASDEPFYSAINGFLQLLEKKK